jgi:hypothetical protein
MSLDKLFTLVWKRIYQDDIAYREINIEREKQYLFTKGMWVLSQYVSFVMLVQPLPKKLNLERHFNQMHPGFCTKVPTPYIQS